jgi:hypothetical protein
MGERASLGLAVTAALVLVSPVQAKAVPQADPIARLSLEGGYDSNVLLDGSSADRTGRVSPELGLRLRDHLWDVTALYGADFIVYRELARDGTWNHRGLFALEATPSRRLTLKGALRAAYAYDPVGLAAAGVFRRDQESALLIQAAGRADWEALHRLILAAAILERVVRFDGGTGGAMHAPSVEVLQRASRRLSVGGAYALSIFQDFRPTGTELAVAHGLRARARYRITREVEGDAFAGPAFWSGPGGTAIVPEAGAELRVAGRAWDLRVGAAHQLGIGTTAAPGLVDSLEVGTVRRFGRRFDLRADGGLWRSGEAPSGRNATLGYLVGGEAGIRVGGNVRAALAATRLGRLDDRAAALRRTTFGLRLGWELPAR